jgi:hypothetical protein
MNNIVWLSSYPKSGNTWLRIFLSNYLYGEKNINDIHTDNVASSRYYLSKFTGIDSQYLTPKEQYKLRSDSYIHRSNKSKKTLWVKAHDAYTFHSNTHLFPVEATRAAIYIVRNPLDVSISYASHMDISLEESIVRIQDDDNILASNTKKYSKQLSQKLGTWADHYNSWTKQKEIKTHIVRYEDLKQDPVQYFRKILEFLDIEINEDKLIQSIENSSFDKLSKQEKDNGFREKPSKAKSFFRKGIVGDYKNVLSEEQIETLCNSFSEEMKELGYMDNQGKLLI